MQQANTFSKTDLDLNNLQGTFDVVPGSENKIGNNFHGVSVPELPGRGQTGVLTAKLHGDCERGLKSNKVTLS